MKKLVCIISLMLALVCVLVSCGDDEPTVSVNEDGYVVVNGVTTEIVADKDDVITVDEDGYMVVNGTKTEHKIHTTDEIAVNADGYVVVNGFATDIVADKADVITVDADGYIVVNDVKTEHKIQTEVFDENPQGLLFVLKSDDTYRVEMGAAKYLSKIEIPATYKGKNVTEVSNFSEWAYDEKQYMGYNITLKEVIIPEGVETINDRAFENCIELSSVVIPSSVTHIGESAFGNCYNLVSITLGANLTSIGEYAFCTDKLKEVINKSSLKIVDNEYEFNDYDFMIYSSDIDIHTESSKISYVDDFVFYHNEDVNYLLCYVGSDLDIILPESYNGEPYEIGKEAFNRGGLSLPITSITLSSGVTAIGNSAFRDCDNIVSLTIPENVVKIADHALYGCDKLVELINKSTLEIESNSYGSSAMEVHCGETKIVNSNDYLFYTYDETNYLLGYIGNESCLVLPENYNGETYEIYTYAFGDNDNIISVAISSNVTNIAEKAFRHCDNIKSITVGNLVKNIEHWAFSECKRLTSVYYAGSNSEWNSIYIDSSNNYLISATHYYYSENEPTELGNYWHYIDGVPTIWE